MKILTNPKTRIAFFVVLTALSVLTMAFCGTCFAEDSFIGEGAKSLLGDVASVVALAGVVGGIFSIVKGRTAVGIIIIICAALLYFLASHAENFGTMGSKIFDIFF